MLLVCALGLQIAGSPPAAPASAAVESASNAVEPDAGPPELLSGTKEARARQAAVEADAGPAELVAGTKETRARRAAGAFAARRYPQAAREYEALFAEFDEPGFLLAAGRSRLAAGHHAHAVAYLSRLLASGLLTTADTQVAYGELAAAQKEVTPVTLRLTLPADLDAVPRLSAEHVAAFAGDPRPALEFPLRGGAGPGRVLLLQLDPGAWRLRVDDPALAPVEVVIDVLVQPGDAVQLDLRPNGAGEGLSRPRLLKLVGALGGLGGALLGTGIGVTVAGDLGLRRTLARGSGSCLEQPGCRQDVSDAGGLRSLGAGIIGAGAGTTIAGLTGLVRDPVQRRRLWLIELVVGGAGIIGGGVAVSLAATGFNRDNVESGRPEGGPEGDPEGRERLERRAAEHTAAAAGLGLGSGLAFAAAVALLRTHIDRRRQLRPALGWRPGGLGVGLSGRF